jgi:anti-sigma-K factor RskA
MRDHDTDQDSMQYLLAGYALGDLDMAGRVRLRRMMAADSAVAKEADELRQGFEQLGIAVAAVPPAGLRAKVLAATSATAVSGYNTHPASVIKLSTSRRYFVAVSALAMAASVACVALVVDRSQLRSNADLQAQAAIMLREPNVVLSFPMQGSGAAAAARGVVLLDLDARRAAIAVQKLPALPSGQAYHLWAVLEDKQVPCGRFVRADNGAIQTQFAIPVDSYSSPIKKLILTVDQDVDQTAPRGGAVMSS